MSFIKTVYSFIIIATIVVCILNVLIAVIKKKTLRLLLVFIWLLFVLASVTLTWIYYQDFTVSAYNSYLAELTYLFDGIFADTMLAKVVLGTNVSIFFVGIIYIIALIKSIVNGIKKTAKSTGQYVNDSYHNMKSDIKSVFVKEKTESVNDSLASDEIKSETEPDKEEVNETEETNTETPKE